MTITVFDAAEVERLLDYPGCIAAVREAMIALSSGERPQPLRQIFTVGDNQSFGIMAKVASAFVKKKDGGLQIGLSRGFHRIEIAGQDGAKIAAPGKRRLELTVPPVKRLFEMQCESQDRSLQNP